MKRMFSFTSMPIQRKMKVLSSFAMFWYLVIFIIAVTTAGKMQTMFRTVVRESIPYDKVAQLAMRELRTAGIAAMEADTTTNLRDLNEKSREAMAKVDEADSYLDTLMRGGTVSNYSQDSHRVLETLTVAPSVEKTETYAKPMKLRTAEIRAAIADILQAKTAHIASGSAAGKPVKDSLASIKANINRAAQLTNDFQVMSAKSYTEETKTFDSLTVYAAVSIAIAITLAIALLTLFSKLITDSIAKPLGSIVEQIKSLTSGEVDLTKKITVVSYDEVGQISQAFNSHLDAVYGITSFKKVIEEDQTLEDVYMRIGKSFHDLDLNNFVIYEVSDEERRMRQVYPLIFDNADTLCNKEAYEDCNRCRAKKTGHTVSSYTYPNICKEFQGCSEHEHICYPITIGGATGGVVQFLFKKNDTDSASVAKRETSLHKANQYLKEALSVLEAKRLMANLKETVLRDMLTGLHNRRFLKESTPTIVASTLRKEKIAALLMCDIDFFKSVNDFYGHETGDVVLKTVAGVIRDSVRETDLVIRMGGEEFLVVLLNLGPGEADLIAEKIRENVNGTTIPVKNEDEEEDMVKTVSIGICEFPTDTKEFEDAINCADLALLEAKETGRNRVVHFKPEMRPAEANMKN